MIRACSFNPCFGGEAIWTKPVIKARITPCVFQSLFWWRGHLDYTESDFLPSDREFQSLFWWRGHLDVSTALPSCSRMSFNPCFGGEAIWTTTAPGEAYRLCSFNPCFGGEAIWTKVVHLRFCSPSVSILVLVERPFGLPYPP